MERRTSRLLCCDFSRDKFVASRVTLLYVIFKKNVFRRHGGSKLYQLDDVNQPLLVLLTFVVNTVRTIVLFV